MQASNYDLYVLKDNKWEIYGFYEIHQRDEAIREAIKLKGHKEYKAVYLIWESKKMVLFSHDPRVVKPMTLAQLREDIAKSKEKNSSSKTFKREVLKDTSSKKSNTKNASHNNANSTGNTNKKESDLEKPHFQVTPTKLGLSSIATLCIFWVLLHNNFNIIAFIFILSSVFIGYYFVNQLLLSKAIRSENEKNAEEEAMLQEFESAKTLLLQIITAGKKHKWPEGKKLEGDTHFGFMIFLTGVANKLSTDFSVPNTMLISVIADELSDIGLTEEATMHCCNNIDEYRLYPKYSLAYDSGKHAAENYLAGTQSQEVINALNAWDIKKDEVSETIEKASAILFTDIVNFTASQQLNGDDWMIEVIHAHNEIVREALMHFHGREIKHTGDGMLISFISPEAAIRASFEMHENIAAFNEEAPSRVFHIRVGISAGEPVHMDGDVFGTPVNLAARVINHADAGETTVSETVPEICEDVFDFAYEELPECALKGFEGTQSVFKVTIE